MVFMGSRLREVRALLFQKKSKSHKGRAEVTPPGRVVAAGLEIMASVGVAWIIAKGVQIWVRLLTPTDVSVELFGFLWATASGLIITQFQHGIVRTLSVSKHLAPYFGHRIYRTYRVIRYGHV